MILTIENINITVAIKPVKYLRISVKQPLGEVFVTAPKQLSGKEIEDFITAKLGWIRKQREKIVNRSLNRDIRFVTGDVVEVFGESYPLNVYLTKGVSRFYIENGNAIMLVKENATIAKRESLYLKYLKEELNEILPLLILKAEKDIRVKSSSYGIKNMKTRWGSCNTGTKKVWFNLKLAKCPTFVLDSIVRHELCHLKHASHNKQFYDLLLKVCPDYKLAKKYLSLQNPY